VYDPKKKGLAEVPKPDENNDRQRAAIAAFFQKNLIPSARDVGADWTGYLSGDVDIVQIDNQVKQSISQYAESPFYTETPVPMYIPDENGRLGITLAELKDMKQ
jgi:hypothetical protein